MRFIYGIGIRGLFAAMWLAARFHPKAKKWISGQRTGFKDLHVPAGKQVLWFHCASLGEFDQGLPVMNACREQFPEAYILVTFFSPSGMDHYHKRQHPADGVCYLPLDTRSNAKDFIAHFKPTSTFFVKYEFWYNHLLAAKESGSMVYGVSSLFRPDHRFFKSWGGFFRKALRLFDHFYVQDERSKQLLLQIGIDRVTISGDTRYDRMWAVRNAGSENPTIEKFKGQDPLILLGSSWPVDEEMLVTALQKLSNRYKILIAPHDISEQHIAFIESLFAGAQSYTKYKGAPARVMILDTIGQLTSAYRYADLAYIGGGFTGKLHNILEPGAFGIPVLFGPQHERFPEAQLFQDRGVARTVTTPEDVIEAVSHFERAKEDVKINLELIFAENRGAASVIASGIKINGPDSQ